MTLGPQFEQLKMLMTGKELQSHIGFSHDRYADETLPAMWNRKAQESRGNHWRSGKVYDSLKTEGVRAGTVLQLSHHPEGSRVFDGHHRIAAAAALEDEGKQLFFPVHHYPGESDDNARMVKSDLERWDRRIDGK